jgi:hypothetical protein
LDSSVSLPVDAFSMKTCRLPVSIDGLIFVFCRKRPVFSFSPDLVNFFRLLDSSTSLPADA